MLGFGISQWSKHSSGGSGPTVGRSVSGLSGASSSFALGFSPAPVVGTWIIAVTCNNTDPNVVTISGGTNAWTELESGTVGEQAFVHLCAAGEPTAYTLVYDGGESGDGACAAMMEVLGANSSNPDASAANTLNTGVQPTAVSSNANDLAVLLNSNQELGTSYTAPPSGYTQQITQVMPISTIGSVFIVTKTNVGSGTITPGSWTITSGPPFDTKLWTVLFKP